MLGKQLGVWLAVAAVVVAATGIYFWNQRPSADTTSSADCPSANKQYVSFSPAAGETFGVEKTYRDVDGDGKDDELITLRYKTSRENLFAKYEHPFEAVLYDAAYAAYTNLTFWVGKAGYYDVRSVEDLQKKAKYGQLGQTNFVKLSDLIDQGKAELVSYSPTKEELGDLFDVKGDTPEVGGFFPEEQKKSQYDELHLRSKPGSWFGGQGTEFHGNWTYGKFLPSGHQFEVTVRMKSSDYRGRWLDFVGDATYYTRDTKRLGADVNKASGTGRAFFYARKDDETTDKVFPGDISTTQAGTESGVTVKPESDGVIEISDDGDRDIAFTATSTRDGEEKAFVSSNGADGQANGYVVGPLCRRVAGNEAATWKVVPTSGDSVELTITVSDDLGGLSKNTATQKIKFGENLALSPENGTGTLKIGGDPGNTLAFTATLLDNNKKPLTNKTLTAKIAYTTEPFASAPVVATVAPTSQATDANGQVGFSVITASSDELIQIIKTYKERLQTSDTGNIKRDLGSLVVTVTSEGGASDTLTINASKANLDLSSLDDELVAVVGSDGGGVAVVGSDGGGVAVVGSDGGGVASTGGDGSGVSTSASATATASAISTRSKVKASKTKIRSSDKVYARKDDSDTPTVAAFTSSDTIAFTGEGTPGTTLAVTVASEPQTATVVVKDDGTWSHSVSGLEPGDHHVEVKAEGASDSITLFTFTVAEASTESATGGSSETVTVSPNLAPSSESTGTTTPSNESSLALPASSAEPSSGSSSTTVQAQRGETVTVTVKDAKEGQTLTVNVAGQKVATVQAGASEVTIPVTVPADTPLGDQAVTVSSSEWNADLSFPVRVAAVRDNSATVQRGLLVGFAALAGLMLVWYLIRRNRPTVAVD
ncbi:hypothetical protein HY374_00215 [Candidatus Berkelbacteria bacterium]|nr:hypothetical protein [Candidatus Berkelbacteria bacterium]